MYRDYFHGSRDALLKSAMSLLDVAPDDAGTQWLLLKSIAVIREHDNKKPLAAMTDLPATEVLDERFVERAVAAFRRLWACDDAMDWDGIVRDAAPKHQVSSTRLLRAA